MARRSVLEDATFYLSRREEVPFIELDGRLFELSTGEEVKASPKLIAETIRNANEVTLDQVLQRTEELKLTHSKLTKGAVIAWLRAIRRGG